MRLMSELIKYINRKLSSHQPAAVIILQTRLHVGISVIKNFVGGIICNLLTRPEVTQVGMSNKAVLCLKRRREAFISKTKRIIFCSALKFQPQISKWFLNFMSSKPFPSFIFFVIKTDEIVAVNRDNRATPKNIIIIAMDLPPGVMGAMSP